VQNNQASCNILPERDKKSFPVIRKQFRDKYKAPYLEATFKVQGSASFSNSDNGNTN
jgi:hypothetical protein